MHQNIVDSANRRSPLIKRTRTVMWAAMTVLCVMFSISAMEFYFFLKLDIQPSYGRLLAYLVSNAFAYGEGSGMISLRPHWMSMPEAHKIYLGIHTVLGGICLIIGPFQFLPSLRRQRPTLHRRLGKVYVYLGMISMVFAVAYLIVTPMDKIFGGAPFALGLWGIAALSTYSFVAGIVHATRNEMWEHRALMMLNFCTLLIAPMLRVWWIVLGRLFPDLNQADVHVAILMFLGAQSIVTAILWTNAQRPWKTEKQNGERVRKNDTSRLTRFALFLSGVLFLFGCALFYIQTLQYRFDTQALYLFSDDAWQAVVRAQKRHQVLFWGTGLGASLALVTFPLMALVSDGAGRGEKKGLRFESWVIACFWGGAFCSAAGLLVQAYIFGMSWIRGWGGSVYLGTMGLVQLIFLMFALRNAFIKNHRDVIEYGLHFVAVASAPITQFVLMWIFRSVGFGFDDAFLSGAVLSTSIHLSLSYYYTAYGPLHRCIKAPVRQPLYADGVSRPIRSWRDSSAKYAS